MQEHWVQAVQVTHPQHHFLQQATEERPGPRAPGLQQPGDGAVLHESCHQSRPRHVVPLEVLGDPQQEQHVLVTKIRHSFHLPGYRLPTLRKGATVGWDPGRPPPPPPTPTCPFRLLDQILPTAGITHQFTILTATSWPHFL